MLYFLRDLPLLCDAAAVNASFIALSKESNGFPANATLQQFVAANFGTAGSDFESAVPDDFSAEPEDFLPNVTDPAIRQWALQVNGLWQDLCREVYSCLYTKQAWNTYSHQPVTAAIVSHILFSGFVI